VAHDARLQALYIKEWLKDRAKKYGDNFDKFIEHVKAAEKERLKTLAAYQEAESWKAEEKRAKKQKAKADKQIAKLEKKQKKEAAKRQKQENKMWAARQKELEAARKKAIKNIKPRSINDDY